MPNAVEPPSESPTRLATAYALLADTSGAAWRPLAGGTDLMVQMTGEIGDPPERVLDIWGLDELRGIVVEEDAVTMGALTTYTEIRRSPVLAEHLPALVDAAATIGAAQIQNRGTIGGNVINASPAGDTLPVLLAAGAEMVLGSASGERSVGADDFWPAYRTTARRADELLLRIRIPLIPDRQVRFRKIGTRRAQAISKVVMALAWRSRGNGAWTDVRLALGSVAATTTRARAAESALEGVSPTREMADVAAAALVSELEPIDDVRSTADYRRLVSGRVLHRMIRGRRRMVESTDSFTANTVTLVFTDIEGSTGLLEHLGDGYATLISDHHRLVDAAAARHGGTRIDAAGDGLFFSFLTARGGLLACVDAQRELAAHEWPEGAEVRVRMGIHTGEPLSAATGYVGLDVHRAARICAAGHGGQILVSQAARSLIGSALPEGVSLRDLGEHRLRGIESSERLYEVSAPGLASGFPPVRSLDTLPNNLPRQLSSFVGRDQEIVDAMERLSDATLLTLTGPGGVGKTRLALEIGANMIAAFPHGVWLVELASVTEGSLVGDALASALKVKQRPGTDTLETLVESLVDRRVLLILDNCEHLMDSVVEVADVLMRRCPEVQVLATSREALGIGGESLMAVPSLSLPSADRESRTLEALGQCDAVRLFLNRARAVVPGFELTDANAEAVAQICRRLDGIPLAVELAAARVRALPPQQIAERLDDRFRLLTGGSRTALPRHRTLRAAMDWSFDLLTEPEQVLLARLAVFAGSFSLEAAEAVTSDGPVASEDIVDLLSHLVDRSLLMPEAGGSEARYRMLETIRDYAQERLVESGEATARYARHRQWFVDLVDRARPAFFSGPVQPEWVSRLAADHDNLRAALRWAHDAPDGADAELSMASGLWRFWEVRGDLEEGSAWLTRALARVGGEVSTRRASALTGAGVLAAHRGDYAAAAAFHDASLMLNREVGQPLAVAAACSNCASVAVEQGNLERARELYTEGIELSRSGDDLQGAAFGLINLADLTARMGETEEADRLYAESIDIFEKFGDTWGVAHASTRLALAARRRGDLVTARTRYEDALEMHRAARDRHAEARVLANLGDVAADEGESARAEALYQESLALRGELGDRIGMATVLERLAGVADDRPARAAVLIGASDAIRTSVGAPLSRAGVALLDQFIARLVDEIGKEAVEAALAEGRKASLSQILARAAGRD